MQLTSLLSLVFLSVAASARTTLRDSCSAGEVISERTVSLSDHNIVVTTQSCPGFSALNNTTASATSGGPTKRQSDIANFCLTIDCENENLLPALNDCRNLANELEEVGSETFSAPSGTLSTITFGTCLFGFFNLDTIGYTVLFSNLGSSGFSTANLCSETEGVTAGFCFPQGVAGDNWAIEVLHS